MNQQAEQGTGRIEVICGCMFSGKTEHLLTRLEAARQAGRRIVAFKHASDDRYRDDRIVSHGGRSSDAIPVAIPARMLDLAGEADLIVIDEAQFFGTDLIETCRELARRGREVVVAGLDRNAWGLPFDPMPQLEALAAKVVRLRGVCARCGQPADRTQRVAPIENGQMVGGPEAYEPRCVACFEPLPEALRSSG